MIPGQQVSFDIAIVGLGLSGIQQITREVEETIRRCTQTYVIDSAPGVLEYLATLCPNVRDLMTDYEVGLHRRLIYREMASEVVAGALEHPPVCFASYGHPKVYCYPSTLIQRAATVLGLKVITMPGISSLDTLLVDLNVDPALDGLQVYEATDLVIRARPLQPDVSCVILQAPIFMEAVNREDLASPEDTQLLQQYLLQFYPPGHDVVLLTSATHPMMEPIRQQTRLGQLAAALRQTSSVATLYIPPLAHRPVANGELADRMKVPDAETIGPVESVAGRPG